jgi:alpha-tubulin suppressor-like RCC1 family protein
LEPKLEKILILSNSSYIEHLKQFTDTLRKIYFDERITEVCCGKFHSQLLTEEGKVHEYSQNGKVGSMFKSKIFETDSQKEDKYTKISRSKRYSLALTNHGSIFRWD